MFKATLSNADLLRDAISAVGELIDEGVFKADKNGLSLTAADRAMVAVVQFKMPPNVFEQFSVDKPESMPIQITNFVSIIKRAKPEDKIVLELKDNKLEVTMKSDSTRKFNLPLIDLQEEELPSINQLEFKTKARIKSDILKNGIDDADVVSDSVVFESKKDLFSMKATGDTSSTELTLQKGDSALLELEGTDGTKARYPLDYLKKMIKASKIAEEVTLFWSKDYPMKLTFRDTDKIEISFVLAPRVQDEE
ncbi:MAG: proliferating cell nuclear antigen (pcna) [Candidatus Aenigmatarchaeota archaeon]|nr:proliferating cell nuclear antigen (pcna) [Candidatus Aenigmarchaeota archaeon]